MISLICIINLLQLTLKHIQIRIVTILSHVLHVATQLQTIMDMTDTCKRRLVNPVGFLFMS